MGQIGSRRRAHVTAFVALLMAPALLLGVSGCSGPSVKMLADKGTPYATWLKFIQGPGWAPSLISSGGQVMDGVSGG